MCAAKLDDGDATAHSEGMRLRLLPRHSTRNNAVTRCGAVTTSALLLAATACGGGQTGDEHSGAGGEVLQELRGNAQRLAATDNLPNSASADTWDFGWKLYREEATASENEFFSPYSISVASAMLVAAARGQTKDEIDAALSFSNDTGPAFHQARNDVALELERRNRPGSEELNAQTLRVSNDLWLNPTFQPQPAYLDTLSANYGVGVFLAPFDTNPEAARTAINEKVATDTERLIEDLLPEGSVDGAAFVLTNALYFKAKWQEEFSKTATTDQAFLGTAGEETVSMMRGVIGGRHFAGADYEAIALPYFGGELELIAIMPPAGTFAAFSAGLTAAQVTTAVGRLQGADLDLRFPKLEINARLPLKERLQALGMEVAFTAAADLSGAGDNLYVSDAFHEATLKLDEEGTEAAAATAFVISPTSAPPPPIPVTFDHPFVFFIRDVPTNSLLFVGHFANP